MFDENRGDRRCVNRSYRRQLLWLWALSSSRRAQKNTFQTKIWATRNTSARKFTLARTLMHKTWKHVRLPRGSCWWDTTEDWQHIRAKRKAPKRRKDHFSKFVCMRIRRTYSQLDQWTWEIRAKRVAYVQISAKIDGAYQLQSVKCQQSTVDTRHTPLIRWLLSK